MKEGSLPLVEPCPGWCQSPGSPGSDCIPNSWVKDASLTSPTHRLVPVELGRRQLGGCRAHALPWVRGQLLCAVRGGHDGEAHLTILTVQGGPPHEGTATPASPWKVGQEPVHGPEPGHGPQTLSSALLSRLLTGDKAGTGLWILTPSQVTKPRARIQQWGRGGATEGLKKMRSLFSSWEFLMCM